MAPDDIQYCGLMKWNDWPVLETEHYLQHYKRSGVMSCSRNNHSFELILFWWTSWISSPNWTEPSETARPAQIYKLLHQNSHLDVSDSHFSSKWAKIVAYLILWWMNSFSAPVPGNSSTRTEDQWAAEMRIHKLSEINIFMVSRGLCKMVSWWRLVYSL